jgi:N-acylglucosamine-6-phosphate 2-epimerase
MAKMALAAQEGGACAIRANTPQDISAIKESVYLPIIGLFKVDLAEYEVYITPRLQDALAVAEAGADIIALDATNRPHPEGSVAEFIQAVKRETGLPVMADISTFDEGVSAREAGADLISTTMSGYTHYSPSLPGPDTDLVKMLVNRFGDDHRVIAEGRYHTPELAAEAIEAGALGVVVGGAITRPQQITARFKRALHP